MNRREFNTALFALAGGMLFPPSGGFGPSGTRAEPLPRVDSERLVQRLRALAEFGKTPEGGVTRVAYSDADLAARAWIIEWMREAGLEPSIDAGGNILGRRAGSEPELPPLMFGSHIDSVPEGGNYDGQVGAVAAIEVAHTLAGQGIRTRHPLEVVIFANEEGGKTGSRVLSGEVMDKEWDLVTRSGKTIREGTRSIGGDPSGVANARRNAGDVAAFLELHIEQGGFLAAETVDVGVVEGIVGIKRWRVTIDGFANHAGTTPMGQRQDALLAAAGFIELVNQVVRETPGRQVGTVGQIEAEPGAPNVIPGRVIASLEIRDLELETIDRLYESVREGARRIAAETGTEFGFENIYISRPAPTDERIQQLIAVSASDLGLSTRRMPSGAGHDAQSIARFAPIGMIFVPSRGGISHSPQEFTAPEDVVNGANVLLLTLLELDTLEMRA